MGRPLSRDIEAYVLDWRATAWPLDPAATFGRRAPLVLEVGFGNGEFLADLAVAAPDHDHLGIELSWSGATRLFPRLAKRGATVSYCEVYERFVPEVSLAAAIAESGGAEPDIMLVTSVEGLTNLADRIGEEGLDRLFSTPILVPGNRIAAEAEKLGFSETVVVNNPGDARMVEALINWAEGEW